MKKIKWKRAIPSGLERRGFRSVICAFSHCPCVRNDCFFFQLFCHKKNKKIEIEIENQKIRDGRNNFLYVCLSFNWRLYVSPYIFEPIYLLNPSWLIQQPTCIHLSTTLFCQSCLPGVHRLSQEATARGAPSPPLPASSTTFVFFGDLITEPANAAYFRRAAPSARRRLQLQRFLFFSSLFYFLSSFPFSVQNFGSLGKYAEVCVCIMY